MRIIKTLYYFSIGLCLILGACSPIQSEILPSVTPIEGPTAVDVTGTATPQTTSPTLDLFEEVSIWVNPEVPESLKSSVDSYPLAANSDSALLRLGISPTGVEWIFALVTPFSSLEDALDYDDLIKIWNGESTGQNTIFVSHPTIAAMESVLGQPGTNVQETPEDQILVKAWNTPDSLAIIPFEQLEPRWKVLSVDGQSPIHNDFISEVYPLKVKFGWLGETSALSQIDQALATGAIPQLIGNRDPSKMTVLVMTGVTALVRATAVKMEEKGMTYPGEAIKEWLVNADLTHISNEVSFSPVCPDPTSSPGPLIFCSKPEYIELLDDVGTDILELTGNHGIDWGRDALTFSLDLYKKRGWFVYASGMDADRAREAVTLEHNGNKLAFIGCNPAGPEFIWANESQSGVANCNYPWMWQRIRELTSEGFQVISTFQYFETYRHFVEPFEERDFRSMVDAGAVIVSGSQAHHPMAMEFYNGSFIHYGLGNLFFDQMHTGGLIPDATRKEFIDRHVFYNNQHISTELLTAMLEDYAQPRPMTPAERGDFLKEIFDVTRWGDVPSLEGEK